MSRTFTLTRSQIFAHGALLSLCLSAATSVAQPPDASDTEPPRPRRGGGARGPGGPGGGFGPGNFLAPQIVRYADTNKDGKLTTDEAATAAAKLLSEADPDQNGSITARELGTVLIAHISPPPGGPGGPPPGGPDGPPPGGPDGPPPGRSNSRPGGPPPGGRGGPGGIASMLAADILNAADTDKDGKLSLSEAQAAAKKLVTDADRDHKGSVSAQALAIAINAKLGPGGGPGGPGGPGGRAGLGSLAPRIIKFADANNDGKLTAAEAGNAASKFVQDADKDKEGWLDFETIVKLFGATGGFGPPPGRDADDYPPRGHGPGDMPAMQLMQLVDSNNDDHISADEAAQAAKRLINEATANGGIDLDGLREILNHQLGSPFGPGGPPPGGFGGPPPGGPREPE